MLAAGEGHGVEQRRGGIKLAYSYVEKLDEQARDGMELHPRVLEFFNRKFPRKKKKKQKKRIFERLVGNSNIITCLVLTATRTDFLQGGGGGSHQ